MRVYADSSFVVRLLTLDQERANTIAIFQRAGRPAMFYTPLHRVEIRTAILQRAFYEYSSSPSTERSGIVRRRDTALGRLDVYLQKRLLVPVRFEVDETLLRAEELSSLYTEQLGVRAIDVIHVASAIYLEAELFLTTDERQKQLARTVGLKLAHS